jgi:FtsP/CotA-like multicopper oxidase with cupredoxin domain
VSSAGRLREYWIQCDSFRNNLVPSGKDEMMGQAYNPADSTYWALGYRAYTPGWKKPLPATDDTGGIQSGMPGPVIRAAVGDTIRVHFRNNDGHYRWPHSLHAHGVVYKPTSDGAWWDSRPDKAGTMIPYGGTYTYEFQAKASSVGTWVYHDHSLPEGLGKGGGKGMSSDAHMEFSAELGLFGLLAITDAKTSRVDREHILFFHDLYKDDVPSLSMDYDAFNGRSFIGNTPVFRSKVGERIRWRIGALGKEFHVFHIHGHRWRGGDGQWTDTHILGPSTTATIEYVEDNPGTWLYHCHVVDHMEGGMMGLYVSTT